MAEFPGGVNAPTPSMFPLGFIFLFRKDIVLSPFFYIDPKE